MKLNNLHTRFIALASAVAILSSCSAPKKVPYLVEAEMIPAEQLALISQNTAPQIQPGDLLNIDVSAVDMASVVPFNRGMYITETGQIYQVSRGMQNYSNNYEISTEYYLVDPQGDIQFPVLGSLHVAGMTKEKVAEMIRDMIYPRYLKEAPTVNVRLMNFRVTVLGAVKTPGVYPSKNERMNFLEALALAGDLDIKGSRDNILLYRTNPDGTREMHRINLQDRNLLLSPYFNMQQNDVIYVVPNKSMAANAWALNPSVTATITVVGGVSALASLIIGVITLTKK